jgi:hypothetical protein
MVKTMLLVAAALPCAVLANPVSNSQGSVSVEPWFDWVAMGPDPGGKSGDTVTPETSKTGHPAVEGQAGQSAKPQAREGQPAGQKSSGAQSGDAKSGDTSSAAR